MLFHRTFITAIIALIMLVSYPLLAQESAPQSSRLQVERLKHTLSGHATTITSVAFSPDGKLFASGSHDGTLIIWEASTASKLHTMKQEAESIRSVAISPDSRLIAVGSGRRSGNGATEKGGALTLWEAHTGEKKRRMVVGPGADFFSEPAWVLAVAFSPDGKIIAGASADGTIRLWDTQTGKALRQLNQNNKRITSIAFSPDGRMLASGNVEGVVILWDTQTWKEKSKLKQPDSVVRCVTFSPDSKTLASGISVIQKHSDVTITTITGVPTNGDNVIGVSGYHLDARGGIVKLWDVETGKEKLTLARSQDVVWDIAFSPNGETVACAVSDKTVRLVLIKTGEVLTLRGHDGAVISAAFSPDGQTVVSGGQDKSVRLWDIAGTK